MAGLPDAEEWVADSNDATQISLVVPTKKDLKTIAVFSPQFTHQIFGDEQQIYGYKDLKINLRYRANDMRPHLSVSYSKKARPIGDSEPADIVAILDEGNHLPKVAFVKASDFEESSKQVNASWTPPGTRHSSFTSGGTKFEIWRGSLADPAVKQLYQRVQLFVPFFIDGGSYIGQDLDGSGQDQEDDDRWTVFFLYQKRPVENPDESPYVFAGFSTVYRFFYFQPATPPPSPGKEWELPRGDFDLNELPCRSRLSQFVILPPFQGKGNGVALYKAIFAEYHKHAQTREFTVEDPNEAFDDLRDVCDMEFLQTIPEFKNLRINTDIRVPKSGPIPQLIVGGENLEKIRLQAKIAPRQFSRVLEMYLMSQLPDSVRPTMSMDDLPKPAAADKHQKKLWQLHVKQRLYRHNRDILSQIELPERIDKLQEALGSVELEHARILAAYERASAHAKSGGDSAVANGKRKPEEEVGETPSKKARVGDA